MRSRHRWFGVPMPRCSLRPRHLCPECRDLRRVVLKDKNRMSWQDFHTVWCAWVTSLQLVSGLVANKYYFPNTGLRGFRNVRLRLINPSRYNTRPYHPLATTMIPTQVIITFPRPSSYSYGDRLSRHVGKGEMRSRRNQLQKTAWKVSKLWRRN